ncbi:MAG TPA: hypothetical protein VKL40_15070 [Candidatus Angelobacter sp.]|nr:hypothetical protein [Candidatus Angelobacter sp.]
MQLKATGLLLVTLVLPALSLAQTKISGAVKCGKPDHEQKIDIGDKPGHAYAISQGKCAWTKPMTIAGIQTKDDVGTNFAETTSTGARVRGYVLGTMSNGDKFTVRTEGTDTVKDGRPQSSTGTWSFASGTGKIKGIQGKGTYKGKPDADGTMVSRLRANTRCRNNLSRVKSTE